METNSIMSQIIAAILPAVIGILAALFGLAMKRLNDWIRVKIENETLETALLQVSEVTETTVREIEKEIRKYMTDGKLSQEEARELKSLAKTRIMSQIPQALGVMATAGIKNLEQYLGGKIEQAVSGIKEP